MSTVQPTYKRKRPAPRTLGQKQEPRVRLPRPHPGQVYVRLNASRFNWLVAGRRWRKTSNAMAIAVEDALGVGGRGQQVFWGAPTFDQCKIGFDEACKAFPKSVARPNTSRMEIKIPMTGGRIMFRSLDNPDNARGHTADKVIIDEAQKVHPLAWSKVLYPMLIDTGGGLWAMGTPEGQNWFYKECKLAEESQDGASKFFHAPTLGCRILSDEMGNTSLLREPHPLENPHIDFKEIERYFYKVPERVFRAEILAEFLADGGDVFRNVEACSTATIQHQALPFHTYLVSCDWAKRDDWSVLTVIDCSTKEIVCIERFSRVEYMIQIARLIALCERFHPVEVVSEVTGNQALNEMLRTTTYFCPDEAGLRLTFYRDEDKDAELVDRLSNPSLPITDFNATNKSKDEAVQAFALALERKTVRIPAAKHGPQYEQLRDELTAFTGIRLPSGRMKYGAPIGTHDDCVMSGIEGWYRARRYMSGETLTPTEKLKREIAERWSPEERPVDLVAAHHWDLMKQIRTSEAIHKHEEKESERDGWLGGEEDMDYPFDDGSVEAGYSYEYEY